jgi:hypothetical protein
MHSSYALCILVIVIINFTDISGFSTLRVKSKCRAANSFRINAEKGDAEEPPKAKMTFGALIQLVTMGAGAPSLGEYERTDENGKMFFKLEANNFADADGNSKQMQAKYFNEGYVEDENSDKPPGFFGNLLSGGQKQRDWEKRITDAKK